MRRKDFVVLRLLSIWLASGVDQNHFTARDHGPVYIREIERRVAPV
jgi:hypothetical protein